MPNLPTLTVSDAQAARITAAFGSIANYKVWLKKSVIDFVVRFEDRAYDDAYMAERASRTTANEASLSDIT